MVGITKFLVKQAKKFKIKFKKIISRPYYVVLETMYRDMLYYV